MKSVIISRFQHINIGSLWQSTGWMLNKKLTQLKIKKIKVLCYFQASQCIVIHQALPKGMHEKDLPQAFDKTYPIRFLRFFSRDIDVTAR